ncbi:hypothetical protein PSTG_16010 [Puccinia striiformis f. sp. tritici PST-78]|nr:hypothetical protein PSTG_16010 [Puccinia striiformis f. sp. tritici PST-78]
MPSASFLAVFIVVLIGQVASDGTASTDGARKCTFYTGANTNSASCNEIPNLICTEGCRDSFVTAEGCLPNDGSGSDAQPTIQVCNGSFGRDTARAKGKTSGYTNCYGCVNTRVTYKVPSPSESVPDSWLNASHIKPVPSPPPVQLQ